MSKVEANAEIDQARERLIEAEEEYQRARNDEDLSRHLRDSAIVNAHRAGLSSRAISELVGDIGQPNVVRARRRATTKGEVIPSDLLSPTDALRESGLTAREFILAVRDERIPTVVLPGAVRAFRIEDVRRLCSSD
jgi:hypothetical protein